MSKNRQAAEEFILSYIEKISPGGENAQLYKTAFSKMSNAEFDNYMKGIETGENQLSIQAPNKGTAKLNLERNIKLAKDLGHDFFQRLWFHGDKETGTPTYLTPVKYMILQLPIRRQAQLLVKKIAIPDNNKQIDQLTGQVTGNSKSSKISYPELQVLQGMGLKASIVELMKYRGGDIGGFSAMNKVIARDGYVHQETIAPYATGVESTKLLKAYLTCAHLQNTL